MTTKEVKRKLAAILSADVEGYSRLMRTNETGTIHTLTAYKEAMTAHIERSRGRVVDSPGDNLLAECAFPVQHLNMWRINWISSTRIWVNTKSKISKSRYGYTGCCPIRVRLCISLPQLKKWPWCNLDYLRGLYFYKDSAHLEHWIDGLRMAGIPEHPPSQ